MPYLTFNDVLEKAGITNLGHEPGEGNMAGKLGIERGLSRKLRMKWCFFLCSG